LKEAELVPERATDVAKNAPSEFSDLDLMAKAKMVKATITTCNKIKDRVKKLLAEAKAIIHELDLFKNCLEIL